MDTFPPELLALVFSGLPYFSLLTSSAVCRCWRSVIFQHVFLCKQIFKPMSDSITREVLVSRIVSEMQFHPAFSKISYRIGEALDTVQLGTTHQDVLKLVDLEIANDFATFPPTTEIEASIPPVHFSGIKPSSWSIAFTVSNPNGVRIIDIFSSMVADSRRKYDMFSIFSLTGGLFAQRLHSNQSPALFMKAEFLGEQRYVSIYIRRSPNLNIPDFSQAFYPPGF
ncbi:hypothetical protein GALMADRAFT_1094462 [Galerina marginata CBS 339.88]|uniref:F-box domain-containing protein n=1 Tax=Galerina marginata (strain CBS 339.88) TaxID=685588 RepID=A0A067TBM7_GALM3|nr:hypothetical protein GALMADRAFT_1094462 [Galerina marginata CBS 339.88]